MSDNCSDCCSGETTAITSTQGPNGDTPVITAGTTTTLGAGTPATLTITGTPTNPVLNFGIPEGLQGPAGESFRQILNNTTGVTLTEAQSGTIVYFNNTEIVNNILPNNPAIGTFYIFDCTQAAVAGYTLRVAASAGKFVGYIFGKKSATADAIWTPNGTTDNKITLNGTTQGGLIGTTFMVTYASAGRWVVSGFTYGSGALATPFSTV